MSEDQGSNQFPESGESSFGSGLGSDFKPLGRRIKIAPARNHRKLVVRNIIRDVAESTTCESSND